MSKVFLTLYQLLSSGLTPNNCDKQAPGFHDKDGFILLNLSLGLFFLFVSNL